MGNEWRSATVSELHREGVLLVEDGNHGEYRPRRDEFVETGVAFICAADMDVGRVLFESASKINAKARERITKGIGAPGDVLLSHKDTVGKVAFVPNDAPPFVCSPQTTFWRTLEEERLDRRYLYAYLRSPDFQAQLRTRSGENDMAPYVSVTSQRGFSIKLPPIAEQRAIAHILGTLDDKIELNRRMNETLEAMAWALFKSWFVDFDPAVVNALRAGNPIPDQFAERAVHYQNPPLPPGEGQGVRASSPLPPAKGSGVRGKLPPKLLAYARELRKNQTDAERLMWHLLRNRQFLGIKFRRQHPIPPYIADFYAHELGWVIEIDGGHHAEPKQKTYDEKRTAFLEEKGLTVIRYWANDVLKETKAVLQDLYQRVEEMMPSPRPSPTGRGRNSSPPAPLPVGEGSILPDDILHLFPARFVDSELGPIPEGWRLGKLDDLSELNPESWTRSRHPSVIRYVDLSNTKWGKIESVKEYEWDHAPSRARRVLRPGDTIFGTVIPANGSYAFVTEEGLTGSTGFAMLRPRDLSSAAFVYLTATSKDNVERLARLAHGTAYTAVRPVMVANTGCILPNKNVLSVFTDVVHPLITMHAMNEQESRTLAALRNTLLPKPISGELRVPDVEKIIGRPL